MNNQENRAERIINELNESLAFYADWIPKQPRETLEREMATVSTEDVNLLDDLQLANGLINSLAVRLCAVADSLLRRPSENEQ